MRQRLALALLISSVLAASACSRELLDEDVFAEPDLSGSVHIPLSASSADGTQYLLRDTVVELSGSAMVTLSSPREADVAGAEPSLHTPLPAGAYTVYLRPGYQVIEVAPDGAQRTLPVAVQGQNPKRFQLREVEDATLKLSFTHEGRALVFGENPPLRITRR